MKNILNDIINIYNRKIMQKKKTKLFNKKNQEGKKGKGKKDKIKEIKKKLKKNL